MNEGPQPAETETRDRQEETLPPAMEWGENGSTRVKGICLYTSPKIGLAPQAPSGRGRKTDRCMPMHGQCKQKAPEAHPSRSEQSTDDPDLT